MLFGKCCCDIVCCCVDGKFLPERMPRKECKNLGGQVVSCPDLCMCPECVPTVTVGGIEFPMNPDFWVISSICDRTLPPFGFPDAFDPLCVTGKIDKVRAFGYAAYGWNCFTGLLYVQVLHSATIECDKGWGAGDLISNFEAVVTYATWSRLWEFYFQGEPEGGSLCFTGQGGPPLVTVEFSDALPFTTDTDLSGLAAESQECHDLLTTQPVISINCGSEEDLPEC